MKQKKLKLLNDTTCTGTMNSWMGAYSFAQRIGFSLKNKIGVICSLLVGVFDFQGIVNENEPIFFYQQAPKPNITNDI